MHHFLANHSSLNAKCSLIIISCHTVVTDFPRVISSFALCPTIIVRQSVHQEQLSEHDSTRFAKQYDRAPRDDSGDAKSLNLVEQTACTGWAEPSVDE